MEEKNAHASRPGDRLFYDAFKASAIGIALEDLEGRPLFVNPALCSMLGFSEEEMLGKRCVEFSPPEDAEKDWALFQQLRAGLIDHYHLDKRFFRRDGSLIWGRLSISLLKNGSSPLVVAIVEDITERKLAEAALRESEERLRMATQAGRMLAYEWDAATDEIVRSDGVAQILGEDEGPHTTVHRLLKAWLEPWARRMLAPSRALARKSNKARKHIPMPWMRPSSPSADIRSA
jgi:PAS domain S-box-containing protein